MDGSETVPFARLRAELKRLLGLAGEADESLLQELDELAHQYSSAQTITELRKENERLKQEVRRLHGLTTGGMSSRLREALRE